MGIYLIVLAILVVIAGMAWLAYGKRPRRARPRRAPAEKSAPARPGGIDKLQGNKLFWGVELSQTGCQAARGLHGQRYSFENAPVLPVAGCDMAACTCQFRGLLERRMRIRRTHPDRREVVRFDVNKPDRRSRISRRRVDKWADHTY